MENTLKDFSNTARKYRECLLKDEYRPTYHFAFPDSNGISGDSNGAFFADGRYHLMYLYYNDEKKAYHWGHISSIDLLHWRNHPDALEVENGGLGCYSGGAFLDDDKTCYITFWELPEADDKQETGGTTIAYSKPPYDKWERIRPMAIPATHFGYTDMVIDGEVKHICSADPSNIWKIGDCYYMQTGNLMVLNAYGRNEDSAEEYKGDHTDLFKSYDLKNWEYAHRFYTNPHLDSDYPDETEDDMCPSFLKLPDKKSGGNLTDKWLQLFISHNKGGQYYIGELRDETFYPQQHGRFTWKDKAYFAPEALIDDKNRQIAWFWLLDNPKNDFDRYGWSGVYGFPRVFWLENDILHMAPAEELDRLQYNGQKFNIGTVDAAKELNVKNGELLRINAEIKIGSASKAGFSVRCSKDNNEHTDIYVDTINKKLVFDATNSGNDGWKIKEEAPFTLEDGETLKMDIFIDKSVIEVYVNERQAICRRVYPTIPAEAVNVYAISDGADFGEVSAWEMFPANPY